MGIPQLSVFLENRPGHLARALAVLASTGINVCAFAIADTADYGVLRLVVDDPPAAEQALGSAGYVVLVNEVVAVRLPHVPGSLAAVAQLVSGSKLDIEYIYLGPRDALLARTTNTELLERILVESGYELLDLGDLVV